MDIDTIFIILALYTTMDMTFEINADFQLYFEGIYIKIDVGITSPFIHGLRFFLGTKSNWTK